MAWFVYNRDVDIIICLVVRLQRALWERDSCSKVLMLLYRGALPICWKI